MSNYDNIFLEIENLIKESEAGDDSSIRAGQDYLKSAQEKINQIKKDGFHKKKSDKKEKRSDKDKISGSKNKFKKEEEEETKEKPDVADELDKEFDKESEEDEEKEELDLGQSSKYSKLIDMLNQFRSAKSFTGDDVAPHLKTWFERLSKSEKKILHLFVKGLIQVTISGETGEDATVPSELGFKVVDNKISKEKKKRIEDKMQDDSEEVDDKKEKEDEIEPPVKIESVQNKKTILEAFKRNVL